MNSLPGEHRRWLISRGMHEKKGAYEGRGMEREWQERWQQAQGVPPVCFRVMMSLSGAW